MDPFQSFLSYVSAALPATTLARPPLTLAVDLIGLALALSTVRARPFAPAGARRLTWLAMLVGGLAPLLASLGPWASTYAAIPSSDWNAAGLAAVLFVLLLLGAATGRLGRGGRSSALVPLCELAGLLVVAAGLAGVTWPALAAAGWVAPPGTGALPPAGVTWSVALAGAIVVLGANAARGRLSPVPRGRRTLMALGALAYAVVVTGVTFLPDWVAGSGVWAQFALAVHVADALALVALACAARHMLNRPTAADYWARAGTAPARQHRRRVASALPSAPITPAVTTSKKPEQVPALTSFARPVVPPSALAPFTPPALRRTVVYGPNASATVQSVSPAVTNELPPAASSKAPLVPPHALSAAAEPEDNPLPSGERAATLSENRATEVPLSPQFVEAVLMLQTEMLRAGKHYSFAELVDLFGEVHPRTASAMPRAFGRAGALERGTTDARPPAPTDD